MSNVKDWDKKTPYCVGPVIGPAFWRQPIKDTVLLQNGAILISKDDDGKTLCMMHVRMFIWRWWPHTVNMKTTHGSTPMQVGLERNHTEVLLCK